MTDETTTAITGSITDTDEAAATPAIDAFDALLEQGFDAEAAVEIERTTEAAEAVIEAVQTDIDPNTLGQRVALSSMLIDDTPSMGIETEVIPGDPESKITVINMALRAHDKALDTIEKVTADEPVDVLASASWMNGTPSVIYRYTRIADAPRFGSSHYVSLTGMTAWYERYAEMLAGTAKQMGDLEEFNKTVYGMAGLVTDGFDNASRTHTIDSMAKIIKGFRRMKTFVPYAIYTGAMPQSGTFGYVEGHGYVDLYEHECRRVRTMLSRMGVDDVELVNANSTLEDLVRAMFVSAGFDPAMVFMPGQDPRAIVAAFVTVSKLMASVSKGQMPEGLTSI